MACFANWESRACRTDSVSSFSDWAAEMTDALHAVMEAALSHTVQAKGGSGPSALGPVRAPTYSYETLGGLSGPRTDDGFGGHSKSKCVVASKGGCKHWRTNTESR